MFLYYLFLLGRLVLCHPTCLSIITSWKKTRLILVTIFFNFSFCFIKSWVHFLCLAKVAVALSIVFFYFVVVPLVAMKVLDLLKSSGYVWKKVTSLITLMENTWLNIPKSGGALFVIVVSCVSVVVLSLSLSLLGPFASFADPAFVYYALLQ